MTDQIASLVVEVDASGAKKAAVDLDSLTRAADRADAAANDLEDSTRKLSAAEKAVADEARRAMGTFNGLADEQEAAARTAQRLNAAHGSAVISSKALNQATLNLGRQFSDVGVSLASGMNPLMVLVQQGPQISEIFATLKTEGIGAGAAFKSMGAALAPALPLILGIGAAVGVVVGAFALFERAVDKETKHATTFGDTWKATLKVTGDYIMDGPIGDGLKWLGKAFNTTLDAITGIVAGGAVKIAGFFGASYLAIVNNWKRLPEVVGVILQNAANAAIKATEWLINKGIDGINALGKKFGFAEIGKVALGQFKSASTDIAKQFDADQKRIEAETVKGMKEFVSKVAAEADKNFEKRQKASKGAAKATEEHTKAVLANNDAYRASEDALTGYLAKLNEEIATMGMSAEQLRRRQAEQMALAADTPQIAEFIRQVAKMYEDQARVGKEAAEVQKAIGAAANDNIKAFDALGVVIPTAMENAAYEMERVSALSKDVAWGVEDIADAINRNDWTSAFVNLARVLSQVQNAFKTGADSATKFAAAAGLAQGVGAVVGGSTGSAISGTASGALAGFQLTGGNPIGAVIGGGIGLVTSLFGSSKAKKQAKAQAAAQAAAAEAQRQQQISDTTFSLNVALLEAQGKAEEALAMTRKRELDALAKLDPSLVALQQQLYDLEDVANATAKAAEERARWAAEAAKAQADQQKIALDLMALDDAVTGGNSAVLAARQIELAALDATSQELKRIYYARLDEGEALAKQAAANEKVAETARQAQEAADELARTYQEANIGLMRQLMAMDDAVLGTTSARDAIRADELAKLDDTGKYLQGIIWAREDEAAVMAKQAEEAARQAEAIEAARNALSQSYEREKSAIEATRQKFEGLAKSLRDFSGSISSDLLATADPASQRAAAASAFFDAANRAALGDFDAASLLPKLGEAFKVAAEAAATDQLAYLRDLTAIKRASDKAAETAERQVSAADRQLDVLNQQVAGLLSIDESVDSVAVAIEKLIAAQGGNRDVAGAAAAAAGLTAAQLSANGNAAFAYGLANSMVGKALAGSTDAAYTAIANAAKGFTPSAGSYFAEGGVFTNGIVSQPTNFSIGQMGEAGPEAIVPLVRGPEGLGVRMSGGNDNSAVIARLEARLASMEAALIAIATSNNSMDRREKRAEVEGYYVRGATPEDPVVTEAA